MTVSEDRKKKDRASRFKGVYKSGKKWKAQIQIDGKQHYLGVYDCERDAAVQYKQFAAIHGRLSLSSEPSSYPQPTEAGFSFDPTTDEKRATYLKGLLGRGVIMLSSLNAELVTLLQRGLEEHDMMDVEQEGSETANDRRQREVTDQIEQLGELVRQLVHVLLNKRQGAQQHGLHGSEGTAESKEADHPHEI